MNKHVNLEASATESSAAGVNTDRKADWRDFVQLTKPGIIRSNLIAAFGGFWLASQWQVDWLLLVATLIATGLVMASSCVFNNYFDRDLDKKMERTQARALPAGKIHPTVVFWYATLLGVAGLIIFSFINILTVLLALTGMFVYVIVYTVWLKRTSTWSTSVGGISGAMPPVIGYCAVSGTVDMGAILLFALLFLWQPPHFWSLGIMRREDYINAGFPLLPVVKGVKRTKIQTVPYVLLLIPVSILFYTYELTGMLFLIVSTLLSVAWLALCIFGFFARDEKKWARQNFLFSINFLMIVFVVMILNTVK